MNPITRKHLYYTLIGLLLGTVNIVIVYFLIIKPNEYKPK